MKTVKITAISIITIFSFWYIVNMFITLGHRYKADFEIYKQCQFLLSQPLVAEKDFVAGYSWVRSSNIINELYYPDGCTTRIWDFNDVTNLCLDSIYFDKKQNIDYNFKKGNTLDKGSSNPIDVISNIHFERSIHIDLNRQGKISNHIKGNNYIGVIGVVNDLVLSNENNKVQAVLYDNLSPKSSAILFYKKDEHLYMIYVRSKSEGITIDESILDYFNLD